MHWAFHTRVHGRSEKVHSTMRHSSPYLLWQWIDAHQDILELQQLCDAKEIKSAISHLCMSMEWHFILPQVPHSGRLWEVGVWNMKALLRNLMPPHHFISTSFTYSWSKLRPYLTPDQLLPCTAQTQRTQHFCLVTFYHFTHYQLGKHQLGSSATSATGPWSIDLWRAWIDSLPWWQQKRSCNWSALSWQTISSCISLHNEDDYSTKEISSTSLPQEDVSLRPHPMTMPIFEWTSTNFMNTTPTGYTHFGTEELNFCYIMYALVLSHLNGYPFTNSPALILFIPHTPNKCIINLSPVYK